MKHADRFIVAVYYAIGGVVLGFSVALYLPSSRDWFSSNCIEQRYSMFCYGISFSSCCGDFIEVDLEIIYALKKVI